MSTSTTSIKTLHASFNLPLTHEEIPLWRGAFVEMAGREYDLLHNHVSSKEYHHRYPLVQYRSEDRRASMVAINEGIGDLQSILANAKWMLSWKKKDFPLRIEGLRVEEHRLRMLPQMKPYRLHKWLALNRENHQRWNHCRNLSEKAALLERVLVGQILGLCRSLHYELPQRLEVNLQHLHRVKPVLKRGVNLLAFDLGFDANVDLPLDLALGKSVSHGFGTLEAFEPKGRRA